MLNWNFHRSLTTYQTDCANCGKALGPQDSLCLQAFCLLESKAHQVSSHPQPQLFLKCKENTPSLPGNTQAQTREL